MGTKTDGYRLLRESDTLYEAKRIEKTNYDARIKEAIRLIELENPKEAERVAKARGYDI